MIADGHEIFNGTCGHCHGADAIQAVEHINLRHLQNRYGDKYQNVFHYTVTHGREAAGMPNWTGVFDETDFTHIFAYLQSVQNK